jgi:hypothetical protein
MTHTAASLIAVKLALGTALALGFATMPAALAHEPRDVYAIEVGDDNGDGIITEDESGWSCVDHGNHICGPNNEQGSPAGRYDVGGVLMDPWPVDPSAWDGDEYVGPCRDICLGA